MNIRITNCTRYSRMAGMVPILLISLALSGCGKKLFPTAASRTQEGPPQVRDLRAEVRSGGVELNWSVPAAMRSPSDGSDYVFAMLRSELSWEDRNCENCPTPIRSEVLRVDPAYPAPATIQGDRLTWIDSNVSLQHAYRYVVAVKDRKGRTVSQSNPTVAKVLIPPAAPTELVAVPEQEGILLQWRAVDKNEQGRRLEGEVEYVIERHGPNEPWQRLSKVPVKGNVYLDSVLAPNQTYNYRVIPELLFEGTPILGEPVAIHQIKAPDALPPPPPKSVWIIPAKGTLEVHWTPSDGKVGGYHVYRKEGKEIIRLTASPVQSPPFSDHAVKRNQTYYYAVSAVTPQPDQQEGLLSKWKEVRSVMFEE